MVRTGEFKLDQTTPEGSLWFLFLMRSLYIHLNLFLIHSPNAGESNVGSVHLELTV